MARIICLILALCFVATACDEGPPASVDTRENDATLREMVRLYDEHMSEPASGTRPAVALKDLETSLRDLADQTWEDTFWSSMEVKRAAELVAIWIELENQLDSLTPDTDEWNRVNTRLVVVSTALEQNMDTWSYVLGMKSTLGTQIPHEGFVN